MTETNPPLFQQTGCYPADTFRGWMTALAGGVAGVYGPNSLTPTSTGSRNVSIAGGYCFVAGTQAANQGLYWCTNNGAKVLSHNAGDATNPRIDVIVARVYDSMYGTVTGGDRWALEIVLGTPAASPAAPALPANSLAIANVRVNAGATVLTAGDITDVRTFARTQVSQYVRTTDPDNAVGVDGDIWIKVT